MAESINYTSYFEIINPDNEPVMAALFTSYGFDAELFEKHILPDLLSISGNSIDNERFFRNQLALRLKEVPITVFSDANQYNGGRTFMYEQYTVSNVTFHPKCQMLLFRDHLRLIVGSCNITKPGLFYNAETVWHYDIYDGKASSLTPGVKEIVSWLISNYGGKDEALKEIKNFIDIQPESNGFPKLLYTMKTNSIYEQFLESLRLQKAKITCLSIVSPFFENERESSIDDSLLIRFVDDALKSNENAVVRFYFPAVESDCNYKVTAPVNILSCLCAKHKSTELYAVNNLWPRDNESCVLRTLHAKIIVASLDNGNSLTLSGSTNFTNSAMLSSNRRLSNVEISVLEYGKSHLVLPYASHVDLNHLEYIEKKPDSIKKEMFVSDAYVDADRLVVSFNLNKAVYPFTVIYQQDTLFTVYSNEEINSSLEKHPFRIKKSMDIKIVCPNYVYYYPITITNKTEYITDDLKIDFSVKMNDVIDYWAGKYRSIQEMQRVIELRNAEPDSIINKNTLYFRHNLQRYFKALKAIKEGLESPFYTETSFNSYISDVFGIKTILTFILDDYKNNVSADCEAFVLLIEFKNIISHLKYQEDRLSSDYKNKRINEIFSESNEILKTIYIKASKKMKAQYNVLLNAYELDIRK